MLPNIVVPLLSPPLLSLPGLCQATALLTFVAQIGSEFEANLPFSHRASRLTTFYRYKYGVSFYLFLLSFGLSELGAFFDMLAYFRKYPPNHYVITFSRQEPSPFLGGNSGGGHQNSHHHSNSIPRTHNPNNPNLASGPNPNPNTFHHQHLHHHHLPTPQYHTLPHHQQHHHHNPKHHHGPDLCSDHHDYNGGDPSLNVSVSRGGGLDSGIPLPPQSYMNPEVTITTIERNSGALYGTLRNAKLPGTATMESFGTMRKENNI
jgi:hypothetical protein